MKPEKQRTLYGSLITALTILAVHATLQLAVAGHDMGLEGMKKGRTRTDTIAVPEMQCGLCEGKIKKTLMKLKGVIAVSADADADQVVVTYDPRRITTARIERAIAGAGYDAGHARTTAAAQRALPACCQPGGHDTGADH